MNGFAKYDDLSDWLNGLGYNISRSAIHRFAIKFKPEDGNFIDLEDGISQSNQSMYELKMRCVESAVNSGASDVLNVAKSYFDWITSY